MQRAISEAAEFFNRGIANELDLQSTLMGEQHKHLENQIKEMKQDSSRDRDQLEARIRSTDLQNAELSAIEYTLREQVEKLSHDKVCLEDELQKQIDTQKYEMQREVEEQRFKVSNQEGTISDLSRKIIQMESETDKDKALLEQKIEFLERNISEN